MARWEPNAADRLMVAALELFERRGYEATTIDEITAAAGLTKRTYFRHFPDKREVLFRGTESTVESWVAAVKDAPASASALEVIEAGFDPVAERFDGLHAAARRRARIIDSHHELQERELIKLERMTLSLADALRRRGVPGLRAELVARIGTSVFHTAFNRWVAQARPVGLRRLMDESFAQVRGVVK